MENNQRLNVAQAINFMNDLLNDDCSEGDTGDLSMTGSENNLFSQGSQEMHSNTKLATGGEDSHHDMTSDADVLTVEIGCGGHNAVDAASSSGNDDVTPFLLDMDNQAESYNNTLDTNACDVEENGSLVLQEEIQCLDNRSPSIDTIFASDDEHVDTDVSTVDFNISKDCGTEAVVLQEDVHHSDFNRPPSMEHLDSVDTEVSTISQASTATAPLRQKRPAPETWARNINKTARLEGRQYSGKNDRQVDAKKIGKTCSSPFCAKSSLRHCSTFSEEERLHIFEQFWLLKSWDERRTCVRGFVEKVDKKVSKCPEGSQRECVFSYALMRDGARIQVCKSMVASTLGINLKTLHNWILAKTPRQVPQVAHARSGIHRPVATEDWDFLTSWLNMIPNVPSHYCRQQKTYEGVKFIFPDKSLVHLHDDYVKACSQNERRSVGRKLFSEKFHSMKFSFFKPRKDQCDVCVGAKLGNIQSDVYNRHVLKKNDAQEEKKVDKNQTGPTTSVWTMDLQAVLTCPKTQASAMYYKTKLTVHNMTYYNLKSREAFNFVFDETNGDMSSSMFACLHYRHFKKYLRDNPEVSKLIIWSDGCGYQNKCTNVANALVQLAVETGVLIEQKYLVSGHTQMECDSVHSVIERKLRNCDIYVPYDYLLVIRMARENPFPYQATEIVWTDAKKLSSDYVKSIRPGKKDDPTVSNVCTYQYSSGRDGPHIKYKLEWSDEWSDLPCRMSVEEKVWVPLFRDRPVITARKLHDLLSMKEVVPCHALLFYNNLPHS